VKETVVDPVWRRRLLMFDAVLILVLGWLLWGAFGDGDDAEVEAGQGEGTSVEGPEDPAADPIAPPPR
jgi:hypothetical protein